jgi:hypothetical protein
MTTAEIANDAEPKEEELCANCGHTSDVHAENEAGETPCTGDDCACDEFDDDRASAIYELAREQWHEEGSCEIDEDGEEGISEGDDNGAYVRAWVWVSFADTPLDKRCDECREMDCDGHEDEDEDEDEADG